MNRHDIAIRVEQLGKMYRIGRPEPSSTSISGRIKNLSMMPFSWLAQQLRTPTEAEILWALRDVSFEVRRGEVLGIIGANGAGKSTLLKVLSRITLPTEGYADVYGRVASLLEVGTGMHPELTGRENTFLNGTILGMTRKEVAAKFEEIVDFAGVEKFIDTPVKRYSSGMRVRLGFAIAAHLEPEILIIDEVLAVGDVEFQAKCLGRMQDVASHGRTVLFVSHNMGAISQLCSRCVLVADGKISYEGTPSEAILRYHDVLNSQPKACFSAPSSETGNASEIRNSPCLKHVSLVDSSGNPNSTFAFRSSICVRLCVSGSQSTVINLAVVIRNESSVRIISAVSHETGQSFVLRGDDEEWFEMEVENILSDGVYSLSVQVLDVNQKIVDIARNCVQLRSDTSNVGQIRSNGIVHVDTKWRGLTLQNEESNVAG